MWLFVSAFLLLVILYQGVITLQTTGHQPIMGCIDISMSLVHINPESDVIKANALVEVCGN